MNTKMEINDLNTEQEDLCKKIENEHRRGKMFGGFLIVVAGSLFLAKEMGAEIPQWIFTWKVFLIAVGLLIAVKHKFVHPAWVVLVLVGGIFLLADFFPNMSIRPYLWPVLIIIVGLLIIIKPRKKRNDRHWKKYHDQHKKYQRFQNDCYTETTSTTEELLDYTTFMGAVKKNVLSKDFKGGDMTIVFGGTEINLLQADIQDTATLDITCVFGGAKLMVPANWEINSDLVSAFGNVEDKRPVQPKLIDSPTKTLILKGTVFFGGIEIKSY